MPNDAPDPQPLDLVTGPAAQAKRQQIIDGAVSVFLREGYEGTSMSQVAREAGVSKGTLYNYFQNKADLFAAMVEIIALRKCRVVYGHAHHDTVDCRTMLLDIAEAMIRMLIEPQAMMLYRIVLAEAPNFPVLTNIFWQRAFGVSLSHLTKRITTRAERGEIEVADPVFAAEQFAMLCQTRIVHGKRFERPVDMSDAAIAMVAAAASDGFMKMYAPS